MSGDRKRKRTERLGRAVDRLSGLVEHGHLQAATDPAALLNEVATELERLRERVQVLEGALHYAHGELSCMPDGYDVARKLTALRKIEVALASPAAPTNYDEVAQKPEEIPKLAGATEGIRERRAYNPEDAGETGQPSSAPPAAEPPSTCAVTRLWTDGHIERCSLRSGDGHEDHDFRTTVAAEPTPAEPPRRDPICWNCPHSEEWHIKSGLGISPCAGRTDAGTRCDCPEWHETPTAAPQQQKPEEEP